MRSQRIEAEPLATGFSSLRVQYGTSLVVLVALTGVLLAIGCVNLAGLLLARSLTRRHQTAVRLALGASPGRLIQQSLIDGVLLAFGGLAASLPFAWWTIRAFTAAVSIARGTPMLQRLTPDPRVLGFAFAASVEMGLRVPEKSSGIDVALLRAICHGDGTDQAGKIVHAFAGA